MFWLADLIGSEQFGDLIGHAVDLQAVPAGVDASIYAGILSEADQGG